MQGMQVSGDLAAIALGVGVDAVSPQATVQIGHGHYLHSLHLQALGGTEPLWSTDTNSIIVMTLVMPWAGLCVIEAQLSGFVADNAFNSYDGLAA